MRIKSKSAEELQSSGQRTPLDLAVEMLRHVVMRCNDDCRYCYSPPLLDKDIDWLVTREAERVKALARATELEGLVLDGKATAADRAEYRKLKDSGLIGAEDAILIQLRAFNAQARERGELSRERDELRARLAALESKPAEDPDELRQRLLREAAEQLPDGWSIIPEELRPGRHRVYHGAWFGAPDVFLDYSLDDACFWWTCGAITVTGKFANLADTSLRNYPDLVSLIKTGRPVGG